ncbi:MAG: hypothetical protein ACRDKB_11530 [Actinomycetota bacterium]
MVDVVDLGQIPKLALGEVRLLPEEPAVTRLVGELRESIHEHLLVVGSDATQPDERAVEKSGLELHDGPTLSGSRGRKKSHSAYASRVIFEEEARGGFLDPALIGY